MIHLPMIGHSIIGQYFDSYRDLPGKIFDVSKASLVLIAMGLLAKIWGHFLYVMCKAN